MPQHARHWSRWCDLVVCWILLFVMLTGLTSSLNNGLALTPPMGWMTWEYFRCNTDCDMYPDTCLSEELIQQTADCLVNDGYAAVGYKYLIIDDCWLASNRDPNGQLQPDASRFPSGAPALARYVHQKGLMFGIYEDIGSSTCAGYPGMAGQLACNPALSSLLVWLLVWLKQIQESSEAVLMPSC